MTAHTHTEVEHEQLRDMTLTWGGCPEKMIPDMNVQKKENDFLIVVYRKAIWAEETFCDSTCIYLINLFMSNKCLLDTVGNNWRLRLSNVMKF